MSLNRIKCPFLANVPDFYLEKVFFFFFYFLEIIHSVEGKLGDNNQIPVLERFLEGTWHCKNFILNKLSKNTSGNSSLFEFEVLIIDHFIQTSMILSHCSWKTPKQLSWAPVHRSHAFGRHILEILLFLKSPNWWIFTN